LELEVVVPGRRLRGFEGVSDSSIVSNFLESSLPASFVRVTSPRFESHVKLRRCRLAKAYGTLQRSSFFELTEFDREPPEVVVTCAADSAAELLRSTGYLMRDVEGRFASISAPVYEAVLGCWKPS